MVSYLLLFFVLLGFVFFTPKSAVSDIFYYNVKNDAEPEQTQETQPVEEFNTVDESGNVHQVDNEISLDIHSKENTNKLINDIIRDGLL